MSAKKQLLDPLGTLCKLVSLNFSEINTKISIHNHSLSLQKPYNYQFMVRWMNGDGKENVSELYHVISRVIKWYLLDENDNNSEISNCDELKRLIRYLCNAFRKLQETYEYGNVILAVQFYINIMESAISGNYHDNMMPKYILDKEKEYENLLDYDKLKNFWKYDKLKRICELYDACFKVYNSEDMLLIEKEALISGYLQSIQSILEITDGEFHKLIQNSTKG